MRLSAIFCLFLFLATTPCLKAQTGCMDGQVLDTRGNPIHSLSVFATKTDHSYMMEVTTGSDGKFSMTELPAGAYQVFTSDETKAESRHVNLRTIDPTDAERVQVADSDLCAKRTCGELRGHVCSYTLPTYSLAKELTLLTHLSV